MQDARHALIADWTAVAKALDAQGEIELAGDVRYFAKHLPPARTDKEALAVRFLEHARSERPERKPPTRQLDMELTR